MRLHGSCLSHLQMSCRHLFVLFLFVLIAWAQIIYALMAQLLMVCVVVEFVAQGTCALA